MSSDYWGKAGHWVLIQHPLGEVQGYVCHFDLASELYTLDIGLEISRSFWRECDHGSLFSLEQAAQKNKRARFQNREKEYWWGEPLFRFEQDAIGIKWEVNHLVLGETVYVTSSDDAKLAQRVCHIIQDILPHFGFVEAGRDFLRSVVEGYDPMLSAHYPNWVWALHREYLDF